MKEESLSRFVKYGSAIVLCGVVAWGFMMAGSPGLNRELRIDKHRIEDVRDTLDAIQRYYNVYSALPQSLEVLAKEHEKHTGKRYEYNTDEYRLDTALDSYIRASNHALYQVTYAPISDKRFQLCTEFHHSWEKRTAHRHYWEGNQKDFWKHPAGHYCFERKVGLNNKQS